MAPITMRTRKRRNAHVIPPQESVANVAGSDAANVMLQHEKTNVKKDENFAVTTMVSAVTPRTTTRRQNQQACSSLASGADYYYNNESGLAPPVSKRPVRSTRTRSHGRAKEDSSKNNKNTTTTTRGTTSREKKPRGLGELAQVFTRMVYNSGNPLIDLKVVSKQMKVPIRRLYDIINVMEGAGMVERVAGGASSRATYQWIAPPGSSSQDSEHDDSSDEEARRLDSWIDRLRQQQHEHYMYTTDLMESFHEDSTCVVVTNPNTSQVSQYQDSQRSRFSLTLGIPPPRFDTVHQKKILPEAFFIENSHLAMQLVTFPSTIAPTRDKENVPNCGSATVKDGADPDAAVREYSPLKKLLAVIPTDGADAIEGDGFALRPSWTSHSTDGSEVATPTRHPFEALLEASILREAHSSSANAQGAI